MVLFWGILKHTSVYISSGKFLISNHIDIGHIDENMELQNLEQKFLQYLT